MNFLGGNFIVSWQVFYVLAFSCLVVYFGLNTFQLHRQLQQEKQALGYAKQTIASLRLTLSDYIKQRSLVQAGLGETLGYYNVKAIAIDVGTKFQVIESKTMAASACPQLLTALVKQLPGTIFRLILHPNGSLSLPFINAEIEVLTGLSPAALQANPRSLIELIHPDDRLNFAHCVSDAVTRLANLTTELRLLLPSGTIKWIWGNARLTHLDNGDLLFDGLLVDISQSKQQDAEGKPREMELQTSLQAKEILLREAHHRIKNNLQLLISLLELQAEMVNEAPVQSILQDNRNRVMAMATIHESLQGSDRLTEIDFSDYIYSLAAELFHSFNIPSQDLQLEVKVTPQLTLSQSYAIPCGLILNELMTNALKHGFKRGWGGQGVIAVSLEPAHPLTSGSETYLTLAVRNNGMPLPPGFNLQAQTSLGLQLVQLLTNQLQGTIQVQGGDWTVCSLTFPIAAHHLGRGKQQQVLVQERSQVAQI
uniref:histidine kinase n=1 Tax=Cyanothece sp. (strain PCC 7425 / ATCC 29141) TaxID=395961 RepID=B8HPA9_CYAP4